jgi:hypothetical protein
VQGNPPPLTEVCDTIMKGNSGRGARRKVGRQLLWLCGGCLGLVVVLMVLGRGTGSDGSKQLRENQQRQRPFGRIRQAAQGAAQSLREASRAAQDQAKEFRSGLSDQFDRKDEGEILELVLNAEIHLVDLNVVEEELLRAPPNSYAGVYGSFCKLDWKLHKKDPSGGKLLLRLLLLL